MNLSENKNKLFDYLPEFIEDMRIGNIIPRDENLIVESFADLIKTHPAFEIIRYDIRYDNILKELK